MYRKLEKVTEKPTLIILFAGFHIQSLISHDCSYCLENKVCN